MYVCMCVYIHIYMYIHVYIYKYEYIHIFIYSYIHIFIYSYIHIFIYSYSCSQFLYRLLVPSRTQDIHKPVITLAKIASFSSTPICLQWTVILYVCIYIYVYIYMYFIPSWRCMTNFDICWSRHAVTSGGLFALCRLLPQDAMRVFFGRTWQVVVCQS